LENRGYLFLLIHYLQNVIYQNKTRGTKFKAEISLRAQFSTHQFRPKRQKKQNENFCVRDRQRGTSSDGVAYLVHRGAPEIVEKYIDERRMRSQISVVFDRTDVVEDEATVTAVVVTRDAGEHHHGTQRLVQCHFAHWVSGA
jgi:hypothetical protein